MEIKRLQTLATEIFKTIMKNIFTPKPNAKIRPHDIIVRHHNTAIYGDKSLTALGPKRWKKNFHKIKVINIYHKMKEYIRTRFGSSCKCNVCKIYF